MKSDFLRIALAMLAAGLAGCDRPPSPLELLAERGIVPVKASLEEAAENGGLEIVQLLLAADVPVSRAAVENAVLNDRGAVLSELLAAPGGKAIAIEQWGSLLDASVRSGASSVLRILLELQPDSELRLRDGEPALIFAVKSDSPELAATLMLVNPNLDLQDETGHSALTVAIENERSGLASILLKAGASPNQAMPPDGSPILTYAVVKNQRRCIHQLLEQKPDLEARDANGKTALDHAVAANLDTIALDLMQAGAKVDPKSGDLLAQAIAHRNPDLLQDLLEHGASANSVNAQGEHPLQLAVEAGDEKLVAMLVEAGADPETALLQAMEMGQWHLAPFLIEAGSDVKQMSANGLTLPELAMAGGQNELVRLLVERGANPGRGLVLALEQGNAELVALFAGLAPPQSPADHAKILVLALSYRNADVLERLLAAGIDPNVSISKSIDAATRERLNPHNFFFYLDRDEDLTPLMLAASMSEPSLVRVLLQAGARRGAVTAKWKRYPINFAAAANDLVGMQLLLGRDPEVTPDTRRVIISLRRQDVKVLEDGETTFITGISSGREGKETPPGEFVITDKHVIRISSIYHVEMPHFMRLNCSEIGMHGGRLPGYPASAGCIRLPKNDARKLFKILEVGDRVSIVN